MHVFYKGSEAFKSIVSQLKSTSKKRCSNNLNVICRRSISAQARKIALEDVEYILVVLAQPSQQCKSLYIDALLLASRYKVRHFYIHVVCKRSNPRLEHLKHGRSLVENFVKLAKKESKSSASFVAMRAANSKLVEYYKSMGFEETANPCLKPTNDARVLKQRQARLDKLNSETYFTLRDGTKKAAKDRWMAQCI